VKAILVDFGNFYTKVVVMSHVPGRDGGNPGEEPWHFFGRGFFPTLVSRATDMDQGRMYYEHEGERYAVGYDCTPSLRGEAITQAFGNQGFNTGQALLILKKIIFDYADSQDDLILYLVVDSPLKAQVFEKIGEAWGKKKVAISGFRGYDKRRILKEATIRLRLLSSGDALLGFLEKNRMEFTKALVVDIGYRQTKLYMVDGEKGVELFRIENGGVSFYYEKIVHLFSEEHIEDNHFLWLVKQIEFGCEEVEVRRERAGGMVGRTAALMDPFPKHYDISLVLENVRWDLNKEFKRFTTEILTSYYTNRVEWPDLLVVMGGGAAFNGEILRLSLEESGYGFDGVYIEKQPIYTMLEGAGYFIRAPRVNDTPI
jgi:hypothetical protein